MYHGDIRLGDTIHVKFTTVNTSGAPTTFAGSPVVSAYPGNSTTQLTAGITLTADFDAVTGLNDVTIVASSGNGYATATNYALVVTTGTVSGASIAGYVIGSFSIENRSAVMPTVAARTLDVAATGEAGVDFSNINGTLDAAEIGAGAITSAKFAAGAIDATAIADGAIDRATFAADTGLQPARSNTAQAGAAGTITLDASASATNDFYTGMLVYLTGATGVGQIRLITAYNGGTKVATITPNWATNPDATSTFAILPTGPATLEAWLRSAPSALNSGTVQADVERWVNSVPNALNSGTVQSDVERWLNGAIPAVNVTGVPKVDLVDWLGSAPNALVASRVDASVGAVAANAITASAIAADAIGASELASDAVTEIRSLASGTSDSGTTTTMVDAARTEADTDYWVGQLIVFTSGNIAGQARYITAFNAATDTITFAPATTQAVATQTYEIWPTADFLRPTTTGRTLDVAAGGEAGVDFSNINGTLDAAEIGAGAITAAKFAAGAIDATAIAAGAITAAKFAAGAIDATAIATDAIDSDAVAASAVTEIQSGLATSAALATVQADTDDIQTRIPAALVGGRMDSSVGAMAANTLTASALATDAVDEIWAKAMVDIAAVPGMTASVLDAINWLFALSRNVVTQTATTTLVKKGDGTTTLGTSTVSDDGVTFTRGEFA